jgi:beta-galactosidase/beta-glucuronidase
VQVTGAITRQSSGAEVAAFANELQVPYGRSRFCTRINVPDPHLWWPLGYGGQDLYRLELVLSGADGAPLDARSAAFGIRTVEMHPLAGQQEEVDYRWQFVVNGVPLFVKGANWGVQDPMLQLDPRRYERVLELARREGLARDHRRI